MKNSLIIIPFNALLEDVCNYAEQTVRILSKTNRVVGIALGNPLSLFRNFGAIWRGQFFIHHWGARVFRPIMVIPFQRFDFIKRLNLILNILVLNFWLGQSRQKKVLWFFEPRYLSHFLRWLKTNSSLFDCVDYFFAYEEWKKEQLYCLQHASIVTVNSRTLEKKLQPFRQNLIEVPVGFSHRDMSVNRFKNRKKSHQSLVFGFVGAIGNRLDFNFLKQLLIHRSKDPFVFIGPQTFYTQTVVGKKKQQLFQQLLQKPNVHWISRLSRKKMWQQARQFDVGIIPYDARDLFNQYSFPMKTMEYFYTGLPVISTNIQELSLYPKYVYLPHSRGWKNLKRFLDGWDIKRQREQRRITLEHTWEKKVSAITQLLSERMRFVSNQT